MVDLQLLGRGFVWLDIGTMESLHEIVDFVHMIEERQGEKISAPEENAFRYGWIDKEGFLNSVEKAIVVSSLKLCLEENIILIVGKKDERL